MKEILMPIVLIAGTIIIVSLAALVPVVIYAVYKDLISGK